MSVVLNPLLQDKKLQEDHIKFAKQQTKYKYARIKKKYDEVVNGIKEEKVEKPLSIYQMNKKSNPDFCKNNNANMYLSALNTGKIIKLNPEKMKQYNIIYDVMKQKFIRQKTASSITS